MKFGEMEIHTSFDDKGGMTETEKKGGAFGTKSERLTVTDKDGGKIETEKTKDLFGTRSERLTITTEDVEAMQRFADAEADKLDNALEQSSNPEEGEKTNKFKKALKGLTIGVTLMASTFGGFDKARATDIGDLAKDASTYTQMTNAPESSELDADKGNISEQTITSQHENIEELEQLRKENVILETARDELEENAMELASIDQSIQLGPTTFKMLFEERLLWPQSYDEYVELKEQLRTEAQVTHEKNTQQTEEKFEKMITDIEQSNIPKEVELGVKKLVKSIRQLIKNLPASKQKIDLMKSANALEKMLKPQESAEVKKFKELINMVKNVKIKNDRPAVGGTDLMRFAEDLKKGLISQESYDKYVELDERLDAEVLRASMHKQQKEEYEMRANVLKDYEARAQKVGHLAEQKTVEDAQEYNKLLNYEVEMLLDIIVNL